MFKEGEEYPSVPPEVALDVGWWFFGAFALLLGYAWFRAASVRRALFALEDPRTYAVLRIGFALMTLVCFLNLYPYWRMLWSDEGIFDLYYAQDRLGRTALRGWSPDEGFFDLWAVACFLWNKPSLFYIYGSPDFVVGYMTVFFAVLTLYGLGFCSRVTGVVAWLMMSGIYNRNSLYWEGTDTVYRCFWFILLFAPTGHAWSIDNWWRCRRLRRKGIEAPVYRRTPAWPRYLIMLQLVAVYVTTGWAKTGGVWKQGDALYYALNMDHFYRFEYVTQWVSSVFGLNLFRLNTWVVLWWERLFGLVLFGVILRFGRQHRAQPWYRVQEVPWRKWGGRLVLLAAYALVYRIIIVSAPYCLPMRGGKPTDPTAILKGIHIAFGIGIPLLVALWFVLGRFPMVLFTGRPTLGDVWPGLLVRSGASSGGGTAWLRNKIAPWRIPAVVIDQETLRLLFFSRRVWLTVGAIFHGFLILFMNIGMFPFIMLMAYAGFVEGDEFNRFFQRCAQRFRLRRCSGLWRPAQDPSVIPPRGRAIPDGWLLVFGLSGFGLVWGKVEKAPWVETATYGWLLIILGVAIVCRYAVPKTLVERESPALAYGAVGRTLVLAFVCWHVGAVASHLFPSYPLFAKWRAHIRPVFGNWLNGTGTSQSWQMFSPNPPRANVFMKTVVVLENGERWDLRSNSYHYRSKKPLNSRPNPWIINDRMRKMQRRMVDKGKWYLSYWSQFQCREWALEHGEIPKEIQIRKIVTRIPSPTFISMWVPQPHKGRKDGATGAVSGQPYNPRKLKANETDVQTHKCTPKDVLPPYIKLRYGIPLDEGDQESVAVEVEKRNKTYAGRRDTWEKRRDFGRWWAYERERVQRQIENEARHKRAREQTRKAKRGEP